MDARVRLGEPEIPARIVWTTGEHFGVAFDGRIDVEAGLKAASPIAADRRVYAEALTAEANSAMLLTLLPRNRTRFG